MKDFAIRIGIDVPQVLYSAATYATGALVERLGVPAVLGHMDRIPQPDLVYSIRVNPSFKGLSYICDPLLYEPQCKCNAIKVKGLHVWVRRGTDPLAIDPIGGIFRLLTLLDENHVPQTCRDKRGIFIDDALPDERQKTIAVPFVEQHAELVWRALVKDRPELSKANRVRWPNGAQFAAAVTHDVDAIHLGAPREILFNAARALVRNDLRSARMALHGVKWLGRANGNPLNRFESWRNIEKQKGIRSAFYFFLRPKFCKLDCHDCRSSLDSVHIDVTPLQQMVEEGWEFGLHPAICSYGSVLELARGKQWLEKNLACSVSGLRHHYLGLDWYKPYETFRNHIAAGFKYDSSIAWRNSAGFRAGTCLPYRPFDLDSGCILPLVELPLSIMNNHIAGRGVHQGRTTDPKGRLSECVSLVNCIRESGGLLTLNWHQEVAVDRWVHAGFMDGFFSIWQAVTDGTSPWIATPVEISNHWRCLSDQLLSVV